MVTKYLDNSPCQMEEKTTAIRRIAVLETGISRHHVCPIQVLPGTLQCDGPKGLRRAINWAPILTTEASLSDSYASGLFFWVVKR